MRKAIWTIIVCVLLWLLVWYCATYWSGEGTFAILAVVALLIALSYRRGYY